MMFYPNFNNSMTIFHHKIVRMKNIPNFVPILALDEPELSWDNTNCEIIQKKVLLESLPQQHKIPYDPNICPFKGEIMF